MFRTFFLRLLTPALLFLLPAAAQEIGTVTLLEGPLRVIRGATVLRGAEGVKLHRGDILESSGSGFAQLDLPRGAVVALGPSTRVFLFGRGANTAEIIVLDGWLKAEVGSGAGTYRAATPLLAATTDEGSIVLHAGTDVASIFVESGSAGISSVSPAGYVGKPGSGKAGQFFSRRAGQAIVIAPRPNSIFIEGMPRPFRDTLPSRLARFSGKAVEPRRDHEVSYSEVQPWLTMGQAWRRGFVERFRSRLNDAEFRHALDAHMRDHPEWDPVVHPEKYEAKKPPAPAENPQSNPKR